MNINTYLTFSGDCEDAFALYASALGGEVVTKMRHKDTPAAEHVSADWQDKIMHICLKVGDRLIMGSDNPPEYFQKPQGFSVQLAFTEVAEAERVFALLSEGGTVRMPMEKTFWAERFGMCTDRFGIPWMVNCGDA